MAQLDVWIPELRSRGRTLDRISGAPWGLPAERWPSCGLCGVPLSFIGQLTHHDERLDLGRAGRVVYAFLCKNLDTMDQCGLSAGVVDNRDGAHAVVMVDDAGTDETPAPDGLVEPADAIAITGWRRTTEPVDDAWVEPLSYGLHAERDRPGGTWPRSEHSVTKIGGIPGWIQDPIHNDTRDDSRHYRYVAQWVDMENVGRKRCFTTLDAGRLFLLRHDAETAPELELYYLGR